MTTRNLFVNVLIVLAGSFSLQALAQATEQSDSTLLQNLVDDESLPVEFIQGRFGGGGGGGGGGFHGPVGGGSPGFHGPVNPGFGHPGRGPVTPGFGNPGNREPINPGFGHPGNREPVNPGFGDPRNRGPVDPGFGHPGFRGPAGGWRGFGQRYFSQPLWWAPPAAVLGWVWLNNIPQGYWQCTAYSSDYQTFSAFGVDADQAAASADNLCEQNTGEPCYIPPNYCQFAN